MAYIDKEEYFPIWLPDSLPEDILSGSSVALLGIDVDAPEVNPDRESLCGYIIQDWFGPFLLSPPTRFLRGRC